MTRKPLLRAQRDQPAQNSQDKAAAAECHRLGERIKQRPIDVALVGIGENGHLAFNDPPADFETEDPFIVVKLDEACRKQQFGEGWFETLEDVPKEAITMSALLGVGLLGGFLFAGKTEPIVQTKVVYTSPVVTPALV